MAQVKVQYTVKATQYIDWPEDEMDDFNYDNLECNLEPSDRSTMLEVDEITVVEVDKKPYEF